MEDLIVARPTEALQITDPSMVAEARRKAAERASALGFSDTRASEIAIAVTEICTNLLKHAHGGLLLVDTSEGRLDVLALDKGPGIHDVEACLRDGFSTTGTQGTGLGAVQRFASELRIYSAAGKGAVVWAGFGEERRSPGDVAGIMVAKSGEHICGDSWAWRRTGRGFSLIVADGLGHGPLANTASAEAVEVFATSRFERPVEVLEQVHAALRSTRGAAVAIADVDLGERVVRYAGLGNISAAIACNGTIRHLVSYNGTAGHHAHKIAEFSYNWPADATLVMCSDGLSTHWTLDNSARVRLQPSHIIAALLYRDFSRNRDDATVVVAKETVSPRQFE